MVTSAWHQLCTLRKDVRAGTLTLAEQAARPDFFYDQGEVCVFCDGSSHDQPHQQEQYRQVRSALRDAGYQVVTVRYDRDLEQQVQECKDVFGQGTLERSWE